MNRSLLVTLLAAVVLAVTVPATALPTPGAGPTRHATVTYTPTKPVVTGLNRCIKARTCRTPVPVAPKVRWGH